MRVEILEKHLLPRCWTTLDDVGALHGQADRQADTQTQTGNAITVHGTGMSRRKKERAKHLPHTATPFAGYTGTPVRRYNETVAKSTHRRTGTQELKTMTI